MRIQTVSKTVYTLDELDEVTQAKVIDRFAQSIGEYFDEEFMYEDAERVGKILGITMDHKPVPLMNGKFRYEPAIYYSGFWSQGDGACFEGSYAYAKGASKAIREYAPMDTKLHALADDLTAIQKPYFYRLEATVRHRGHYSHEYCTDISVYDRSDEYRDLSDGTEATVTQILRAFMRWIYRQLEADYEYQTSEEHVREHITMNEFEFTIDGEIA